MILLQELSGTIQALAKRCSLWLAIAVALCLNAAHASDSVRIALLLSESNGPYQSLATALGQQLSTDTPEQVPIIALSLAAAPDADSIASADLVVAIGSDAAQRIDELEIRGRVLYLLIPSTAYEQLAPQREHHSAIFIDQPWERQLNLIQLALPGTRDVGLLLGPTSRELRPTLEQSLVSREWQSHIGQVPESGSYLGPLLRVLEQAEVLLAVPDQRVFNRQNLQGILLTSYRREVPMIGFSPGYVRAGALVAVYSTPEQIAAQAADWIRPLLQNTHHTLPRSAFPDRFSVAVNHQVARSLGLRIPDEDVLLQELLLLEARP